MFNDLSASDYRCSNTFYIAEFENILSKIVKCYQLLIEDNLCVANNENLIRDILLIKYLKNNSVRKKIGLIDYLFDREVPEDFGIGRTDIKIQTINTFIDTAAYYTLECKRLDSKNLYGTTGLNAKYIENGIYRFVSKTYSSHYKINGMIAFIVENIDVEENIGYINNLLKSTFLNANTTKELHCKTIVNNFNYCYCSCHHGESNNDETIIYHLMFDFSNNIMVN